MLNTKKLFSLTALAVSARGAVLLIAEIVSLIAASAALAQAPEPTVLVRRVVRANYHDPAFDQVEFKKLLDKTAFRTVPVKPNSTVSGLLKEHLNASQSWTPAIYDQLQTQVFEMNGIKNPKKDLKAGKFVKIPDLPRTAQVFINPQTPAVPQSKISVLTSWNPTLQAFSGVPIMSVNAPGTATIELQIREIPLSALKALNLPDPKTPLEQLIQNQDYQVMQEDLTLTLADTPLPATVAPLLSTKEKAALAAFLARPARTRPIVVIFDDAYPTQGDFARTVRFVINASREIRQKFGLQDAAHGDSPNLLALEKNHGAGTLFCDEDCEYPKLKTHAAMIKHSLKDFADLDVNQRVEVIYIPVNEAQAFSKELLTEVLSVALLAETVAVKKQLALIAPGVQTPANLQQGKPDYSKIEMQVEKILGSPSLFGALSGYNGGVMTSQTDKAIIDNLVNFLWLYSMASQRPHFLSMSWTTPNLTHPALFRANGYGLWLAAAGNDPKVNIHLTLPQFAARSSDPGDVLAVMNVANACAGSTFSTMADVNVFGMAFPGRITPELCGTSFSTPRIAWLLAAYEAIKGTRADPYTESFTQWRAAKRKRLFGLQDFSKSGEGRYRVSPWQLLDEPAPQ